MLYEADQQAWLLLPEKSFDCARYQEVKADKAGMVTVDQKLYSTSPRYARQKVIVCMTYDQVKVLNEKQEVIVIHDRLYGIKRQSMVWQPYLDLLAKRPRAIKYANLYNQFPSEWTDYLNACSLEEQKAALRLLAQLLKSQDFTLLNQALKNASLHGHPSAEEIKHTAYSLIHDTHYETLTPTVSVPDMPEAARGLSHYDAFFQKGSEVR